MAQQPRLDVLRLQRLAQKRVVAQVDLRDGEVAGRFPTSSSSPSSSLSSTLGSLPRGLVVDAGGGEHAHGQPRPASAGDGRQREQVLICRSPQQLEICADVLHSGRSERDDRRTRAGQRRRRLRRLRRAAARRARRARRRARRRGNRRAAASQLDDERCSGACVRRALDDARSQLAHDDAHTIVAVDGMDCASCARTASAAVGRLDGVSGVEVSFTSGRCWSSTRPAASTAQRSRGGWSGSATACGTRTRAAQADAERGADECRPRRAGADPRSARGDLLTLISTALLLVAVVVDLATDPPAAWLYGAAVRGRDRADRARRRRRAGDDAAARDQAPDDRRQPSARPRSAPGWRRRSSSCCSRSASGLRAAPSRAPAASCRASPRSRRNARSAGRARAAAPRVGAHRTRRRRPTRRAPPRARCRTARRRTARARRGRVPMAGGDRGGRARRRPRGRRLLRRRRRGGAGGGGRGAARRRPRRRAAGRAAAGRRAASPRGARRSTRRRSRASRSSADVAPGDARLRRHAQRPRPAGDPRRAGARRHDARADRPPRRRGAGPLRAGRALGRRLRPRLHPRRDRARRARRRRPAAGVGRERRRQLLLGARAADPRPPVRAVLLDAGHDRLRARPRLGRRRAREGRRAAASAPPRSAPSPSTRPAR